MARLLLGVSGSIAAYKALEFVRLATAAGHGVRVILTEGGGRFIGADSFAALTGAPVLTGVFDEDPWSGAYPGEERIEAHRPIGHLALAERADLFVVAPASANTIARLAGGFADDLLTAAALVAPRLVLAPAMNGRMWEHPATVENVAVLQQRGVVIAEPGVGRLASRGEAGTGRLMEPADLLDLVEAQLAAAGLPGGTQETALHHALPVDPVTGEPLDPATGQPLEPPAGQPAGTPQSAEPAAGQAVGVSLAVDPATGQPVVAAPAAPHVPAMPQDLAGRRILISAGGTREPIDAVRFIGNRSSGRMGFALAEAAAARGAAVVVVAANVALETPAGVRRVDVETAAELQAACQEVFSSADVLIAAAAVADFRPTQVDPGKMKKKKGEEVRALELQRTPDVLAGLAAARQPGQVVIGFAAEHGAGALAYGREKLAAKGLDAIVVNDVSDPSIGFDATDNEVVIVTPAGDVPVPRGPKRTIADAILTVVAALAVG